MQNIKEEKIPKFPSYKEIIQEIARYLRLRKGLLVKKTFRIIWPGIVFILLSFLIITLVFSSGPRFFECPWFWPLIILTGFSLLFTAIYYPITAWIFSLERLIWTKSYFDKDNLSPTESWKQAKKIARPAFVFMLKIFFKFYFLPILLFTGVTTASLVIMLKSEIETSALMFSLLLIIGIIGIPMALYIYYIRVKKLRFVWFVFLDFYEKTNLSFRKIMEINQELNQVYQGEIFKRALMLNFGIESVEAAVRVTTRSVENNLAALAVRNLPPSASMPIAGVAESVEMFTEELTRQAAELSRSIAMYILYQDILFSQRNPIN